MDEERIREMIREELGAFEKSDRFTFQKDIEINDGRFITFGGNDGTKIGNSALEKIGFYGVTPAVQPTFQSETNGVVINSGTSINTDTTFTGNVGSTTYTTSSIVKNLKTVGIIKQ